MNVNSIPRGNVIGTLAGGLLLPLISQAQDCALPAMPDASVPSAQDRASQTHRLQAGGVLTHGDAIGGGCTKR